MSIKCKTLSLVIEYDKKVWPCCYVACNAKQSSYLKKLPANWNDLSHHTLKQILNHKAYTHHFNDTDWNSNECDTICKKFCSENKSQ